MPFIKFNKNVYEAISILYLPLVYDTQECIPYYMNKPFEIKIIEITKRRYQLGNYFSNEKVQFLFRHSKIYSIAFGVCVNRQVHRPIRP